PYIPVRTAEPEAQRQRCAELARPKARPRRPASAARPKSKAEAAEQQLHCSRLARPKGVAMPPSGPASLANFSLGFARSASSSALVAGQTSGRGDAGDEGVSFNNNNNNNNNNSNNNNNNSDKQRAPRGVPHQDGDNTAWANEAERLLE
ncbi:unnamed protein product, partial [Polarella glacialis]